MQINLYGLIIGVAIVVSASLVEHQLKNNSLISKYFYKVVLVSLFFSIFFARLWHVATDFEYYIYDLESALYIWNGGLSILGAVLGGVLGVLFCLYFLPEFKQLTIKDRTSIFLQILDASIFGLPVGQAIGRLGNFVNQELYGLPYSGFFKIYIDLNHRLPGFEQFAYYHPLFFYEMIATGLFALVLYFLQYKKKHLVPKPGKGILFFSYSVYYATVRFFLDFLRIERSIVFFNFVGLNQVILLLFILVSLLYFFSKYGKNY